MDDPRTAREFAELAGRLEEHARTLLDREVLTAAEHRTPDGPARVEAICAVSRAAAATSEALAYSEPEADEGGDDLPPGRLRVTSVPWLDPPSSVRSWTLLPIHPGDPTVVVEPHDDGTSVVAVHLGPTADAAAFAQWVHRLRVPVRT